MISTITTQELTLEKPYVELIEKELYIAITLRVIGETNRTYLIESS